MIIQCVHGYFKFEENEPGEISKFISLFGLSIERSGDHFTFEDLVDAPTHSIAGGTFLGVPTSVTFQGQPWEVMRANDLVYQFNLGLIMPIASVALPVKLSKSGNILVASGMIVPGSIMEDGSQVTDYLAHYSSFAKTFRYSEVIGG